MPWGTPLPTALAGLGRRAGIAWGVPQEPQRCCPMEGPEGPAAPQAPASSSSLRVAPGLHPQPPQPPPQPAALALLTSRARGLLEPSWVLLARAASRLSLLPAQLLQVCAMRMRATEPWFLGLGDKGLLVSRCCGASSCYGASSSPFLILGSPRGTGSAQPAPPSFGVPAPVSVPHGRRGRAVGRAALRLPGCWCNQLLAPRWERGTVPQGPPVPTALAAPASALCPPPNSTGDHAGSFVPRSLLQHLPPLTQMPLKPKLEQNRHVGGRDLTGVTWVQQSWDVLGGRRAQAQP